MQVRVDHDDLFITLGARSTLREPVCSSVEPLRPGAEAPWTRIHKSQPAKLNMFPEEGGQKQAGIGLRASPQAQSCVTTTNRLLVRSVFIFFSFLYFKGMGMRF